MPCQQEIFADTDKKQESHLDLTKIQIQTQSRSKININNTSLDFLDPDHQINQIQTGYIINKSLDTE